MGPRGGASGRALSGVRRVRRNGNEDGEGQHKDLWTLQRSGRMSLKRYVAGYWERDAEDQKSWGFLVTRSAASPGVLGAELLRLRKKYGLRAELVDQATGQKYDARWSK